MGGINREQRRKAAREGILKPDAGDQGTTLAEWLSDDKSIARRGEVWEVIQIALFLHERRKVHNRWYNRLIRKVRRFFHRHFSIGVSGPAPEEEFPTPEAGMDPDAPTGEDEGG